MPHKEKTALVSKQITIWSWIPKGGRCQDGLTDWRTVIYKVTRTRALFTSSWRWKEHGPPKRWYPTTSLRGFPNQKTARDLTYPSVPGTTINMTAKPSKYRQMSGKTVRTCDSISLPGLTSHLRGLCSERQV